MLLGDLGTQEQPSHGVPRSNQDVALNLPRWRRPDWMLVALSALPNGDLRIPPSLSGLSALHFYPPFLVHSPLIGVVSGL